MSNHKITLEDRVVRVNDVKDALSVDAKNLIFSASIYTLVKRLKTEYIHDLDESNIFHQVTQSLTILDVSIILEVVRASNKYKSAKDADIENIAFDFAEAIRLSYDDFVENDAINNIKIADANQYVLNVFMNPFLFISFVITIRMFYELMSRADLAA